MDVTALRKLLFEQQEGVQAQAALTKAKASGISLHNLLEGTILNDFLEKEITKFSAAEQMHLPHQRYDFRLNEDFSFNMEVIQLHKEAAMPTTAEDLSGYWELVRLEDKEVVLKLNGRKAAKPSQKDAYIKISHENIGWFDEI